MATQIEAHRVSARNSWSGRVDKVKVEADGVMAEVVLDCAGTQVVAAITAESARRLGLREGDTAMAVVKATDVIIAR